MITTFRGENRSRQVEDPLTSNTVTTRDNDTFVNDDISDDDEDSNDISVGGHVNASVLIDDDDDDVVFERNDNNVRILVTIICFM